MLRRTLPIASAAAVLVSAVAVTILASGGSASGSGRAQAQKFPVVKLPPGLQIEKVAGGLTYPTAIAWDDDGRMYVAEAGGQFLEEPPPARILRVENGRDFGIARVNPARIKRGQVPYEFPPKSGAVWRVSLTGQSG